MDFSTNHCPVLFYVVWFITELLVPSDFQLIHTINGMALIAVVFNAILFRDIHARSENKGKKVFKILSILLGISFLWMYISDSIPKILFIGACYTEGVYSAFDHDAYYSEDVTTMWIYGFFLMLAAHIGIGFWLGSISATFILLLGWAKGERLCGIDMSFLEAVLGGCEYFSSLFQSLMYSGPLYVLIGVKVFGVLMNLGG